MSVEGKGGTLVTSVLMLPGWVVEEGEVLMGRIEDRLEPAVSGEGPCALV
jgi:hypothetical protein